MKSNHPPIEKEGGFKRGGVSGEFCAVVKAYCTSQLSIVAAPRSPNAFGGSPNRMERTDWNALQSGDAERSAARDYLLMKEDGSSSARGRAGSRTHPSVGLQGRMSDEMSAELFERIAIGRSEIAFKEFHDLLYKGVYSRIFRILKSEQDALDMVQEVFTTFWTSAPDLYKLHTNITAWILLLARNRAIDHTRSKHFRGQRDSESYDDILHGSLSEDSRRPDDRLTSESNRTELRSAFEVLIPKHREIMEHVFLEGMSMKAVAESMQIPLGTVKKTVFSSIRKLRRVMQPDETPLLPVNKNVKAGAKLASAKKKRALKKETEVKESRPAAPKKVKRADGRNRLAMLDNMMNNRASEPELPAPK